MVDSAIVSSERLSAPRRILEKSQATGIIPQRLLYALFAIQGLSAAFFLGDLWSEVLGLRSTPLPYEYQEYIQILASIGLLTGFVTSTHLLARSFQDVTQLQRQVEVVSGNYQNHLEKLFCDWELSRSEREVTVYVMKGFSNSEVAEFRGTGTATVKTQLNAVYRKSGCTNRQQLISYLVEELLSGVAAT